MKHFFKPRVNGLLLTLLLLAGGTQTAFAAGTPSGVTISNIATVNYDVGGVGQTAILSSPLGDTPIGINTDFVVDNKVDLTVVNLDGGTVFVAPGSLLRVLTFLVTNTGNTTQSYSFSVFNGLLNDIPMGSVQIWMDTSGDGFFGGVAGGDTLYSAAGDAGDLDPNGGTDTMTVFIVADTPLLPLPVDGDVDDYNLLATTLDASSALDTVDTAINTPGGVEVVFADGIGPVDPDQVDPDGTHSAAGSYTVASATLTVTKTAVVLDVFGGSFAIPGSTVTYTIEVANTGGSAATTVVISDGIPSNTTLVPFSITLEIDGGGAVGQGDSTPVTVTIPTLSGGSTAEIVFKVLIF